MYVTSFIKKENKLLNKYIKNVEIESDKKLIYKNPKNHSLVGTAYELLFHYKHNPYGFQYSFKFNLSLIKGYGTKKSKRYYSKFIKILKKRFKTEKDILKLAYLKNHREYKDIHNIKIKKRDIRDLRLLNKKVTYKLNEKALFSEKRKAFNIIGEIDILTKDNIIDIKTVIDNKVKREHIHQLVMYYLLMNDKNIKYISIFLSRYDDFKVIKIRDVLSEKSERKLRKKIPKRVHQH